MLVEAVELVLLVLGLIGEPGDLTLPYKNVALITIEAPAINCIDGALSPNTHQETIVDITIDKDVAKPLRILSAYFTVTATTKPPTACQKQYIILNACC